MQHIVIDGRIYRVIQIEAADTYATSLHISTKMPIGATQAAAIRKAVTP